MCRQDDKRCVPSIRRGAHRARMRLKVRRVLSISYRNACGLATLYADVKRIRTGMGNRIRWRLFRTCLCKWKLFVGVLSERHKCFSSVDSQRIAMMQRSISWHKNVICYDGGSGFCCLLLGPCPACSACECRVGGRVASKG